MVLVDALVAEDPAQLVDLVEPADDQPLEVKLGGDAQVKLLVQRVMMGEERAGVSTPGHRHQHRRIHLQKPPVVEEVADAADNAAPLDEHRHHFRVGDHVQVTLAVPHLHVPEAVVFLRQRAHPLAGDGEAMRVDGHLSRAGADHCPGDAKVVAQVQVLDEVEALAQVVLAQQRLDCSRSVLEVEERRPAHDAHGHDASSQGEVGDIGLGLLAVLRLGTDPIRHFPAVIATLGLLLHGLEGRDGRGGVTGAVVTGRIGVYTPFP